jgi:hypothetical protein
MKGKLSGSTFDTLFCLFTFAVYSGRILLLVTRNSIPVKPAVVEIDEKINPKWEQIYFK